jgi:hypothetical protein
MNSTILAVSFCRERQNSFVFSILRPIPSFSALLHPSQSIFASAEVSALGAELVISSPQPPKSELELIIRQLYNLLAPETLWKRQLARILSGKPGMTDALGKEPDKQRLGAVGKMPRRFGA